MISSQTLKTFVKMHEYKLNAKINARRAMRLHDRLEQATDDAVFDSAGDRLELRDDRSLHDYVQPEDSDHRRRPKSRYFNFIAY